MRILLNIALFLVPFILYAGWLHLQKRNPLLRENWEHHPVLILTALGALLFCAGLVALMVGKQLNPNDVYVPARVENGRLVPGQIERGPAR